MFSVTPEPAVSKPAYDPQARQARAEQPRSDGFGALVDSNAAASDTERQTRPAADAPRHRDNANSRPKADNSRADTGPRQPPASAAGDTNAATATTDQTTTPATTPAVAAIAKTVDAVLTPDDAIVSGDASQTTETGDASAAATDAAAIAVVLTVAPAVVDPTSTATGDAGELAVAPTAKTATPTGTATAPTGADAAFAEAAANAIPETSAESRPPAPKAEAISVAVTANATPVKTAPGMKPTAVASTEGNAQATDAAASDQTVKPHTDPSVAEGKPAPHDKAASETGKAETDAPDHAVKHTAPTEQRAATPAPLEPAQFDTGLQSPSGAHQPPLQTHAANLTATPVPQVSTPLASMPVPLSGLAVDIALRAAGGSSRFEIRLDPAELGRIDVRLDVDKHGNVTSHLTVERPSTLDMLRRDAPQLQQALEDAGLKTGDSGLQFSLRDQSSSGRDADNGSGRNSQRVVIAEDDTVPAQVAGRTYGRALGSSSGVDIRI